MMQKQYTELEEKLNYKFKDLDTVTQALTHKSFQKSNHNERLEFLGDAVLNLIIGEYLFVHFPNAHEGELSKIRAGLVNESSFNKIANTISLGQYIYLSASEERNHGRYKASILSDAFEAIMGAIYLESNIETVKTITYSLLQKTYQSLDITTLFYDFKTALQELTQAEFGTIPHYKLERELGPDHQKEFEVSVWINEICYGKAKGASKKNAQQEVAKLAMQNLEKERK